MKRKRLLTLFLAVLLCLPSCSAAEPLSAVTPAPETTVERSASFADVPGEAWYVGAVSWCVEKGFMRGVSPERFDPEGTLTRAMMATVLYRAQGEPAVSGTSSYTDVFPGQWYSDAVTWASGQGIVQGYGNGLFGTEDPVTKEQMEVMLGRYMGKDAAWTGDPALAEPATRGETAAALYREWNKPEEGEENVFYITVNGQTLTADFADNSSARAFRELLSKGAVTVSMDDYGGFEKVGSLGTTLPRNDSQITTEPGDVILYQGSSITIYYDRNSWSFTRLGKIRDVTQARLKEVLEAGKGEVEIVFSLEAARTASLPYDGIYPQHEPYGKGIGAMPGRVVWAHDPASVSWDGSGYWWELSHFAEGAIQSMVEESIASLGGRETAKEGWRALFEANRTGRGLSGGYTAGQKIAIKANINGSAVMDDDTSGRTGMSYTNPVLLKALLVSLVRDAGVSPDDITVYDVSRLFPDYMVELCTAGELEGVRFVGRDKGTADEAAPIVWSQSFSGKVNYLPTCVTQAEYVINLANLKGHSYGVTLCGKNHFGSFINGNAMRPPEGANLHQWLTRNEMGIYSPLVDLMANAELGGKTVLYMLDALICATSEGSTISAENSRWQQEPFHGHYTASVFVSQDPVAIDSVGADLLMSEPTVTSRNGALRNNSTVENYLHEAGLVSQAPSGTAYTDGQGGAVTNLGVHEHWNNATQKQYSRNLGMDEGIELIRIEK